MELVCLRTVRAGNCHCDGQLIVFSLEEIQFSHLEGRKLQHWIFFLSKRLKWNPVGGGSIAAPVTPCAASPLLSGLSMTENISLERSLYLDFCYSDSAIYLLLSSKMPFLHHDLKYCAFCLATRIAMFFCKAKVSQARLGQQSTALSACFGKRLYAEQLTEGDSFFQRLGAVPWGGGQHYWVE